MDKTKRTILQKSIQHHCHQLFRLLRKTKARRNKKSIHQLRVCLKSWKSFYDFCSYANPDSKNSIQFPKKWKNLFHQLGKLREIQVTDSLVRNLRIKKKEKSKLKRFFFRQKKKWKKRISILVNRLKSETKKKFIRPILFLIKSNSEKLIEASAKGFFQNHFLNPFHPGLQRKRFNNLHAKRTHLRKFIQLISFFDLTKKVKQKIPLYEKLNRVSIKLGKWHDAWIMQRHIRKFLKETNDGMDRGNKIALKKITDQKERQLYWESQRLLRDFVSLEFKKLSLGFKNYLPFN